MATPSDFADRHIERWRDHWIDVQFDDEVEAFTVRIGEIKGHLRTSARNAADAAGLQDFEFHTLHRLMIRDTPGRASPTDLARDLGITGAGMTGRLDALEKAGLVKRTTAATDRRRVDVEATAQGITAWRRAMALSGEHEEKMAAALTASELRTVNRLLKKVCLHLEDSDSE